MDTNFGVTRPRQARIGDLVPLTAIACTFTGLCYAEWPA